MQPTSNAVALDQIRERGRQQRVRYTRHGMRRTIERNVTHEDVVHGLANALSCTAETSEKWRVDTVDAEGDQLTLVVVILDDALIVTVF